VSRTERGEATRRRLLQAAEDVFSRLPYHRASIVKITEAAGVAHGTFYLYFTSKQQIFEELIDDLDHRACRSMATESGRGTTRAEQEELGFQAFFRFTAEHPGLYRAVRQAEFVAPGSVRRHYERIAEGYTKGLAGAMAAGEIPPTNPEVLAWCLMGVAELVGMHWVLWNDSLPVPPDVLADCLAFVQRGLGVTAGAGRAGDR
jgi:AcrR family transcriptional regulator